MKTIVKIAGILLALTFLMGADTSGCDSDSGGSKVDTQQTINAANSLQEKQPTPTDIEYSIPRWLLIRRAYFVNGQREKARTLPCPIADVPLGHIVLLTDSGAVVGKFLVEGMVISLNTYLTPDSEYYELLSGYTQMHYNKWLADVDGTYGVNDDGIFFFSPDGTYYEWNGPYLYTDTPISIDAPIVHIGG